ncbi:hypothetical protein AYI75_12410 [Shewanella algae]|uniref:hypothetical protein n=1 Tax=Shewanella algae TaxID=38313 RepID=UPI0011A59FA7|nr:hypothetical protein [Shewanella algae]TWO84202.1 hypothetical protein AYI75_12410 [Shewanella algae]
MEFEILDVKKENDSSCFLLKSTLRNYIDALPHDYDSYDIQRAIVSNSYLDRLVYTILSKGHIPSITLVIEQSEKQKDKININNFKILDGLQRTNRIKIVDDTRKLFINEVKEKYSDIGDFKLKRQFRSQLSAINSTGNILCAIRDFYNKHGEKELNDCFEKNHQWFEAWAGLTPEIEVKKMLTLNAGHKPVNIKHQLEILFQNILPKFEKVISGDITILREKTISTIDYSKRRSLGEYHFSHLISALISFVEKKPVTTTNEFINKMQNDDKSIDNFLMHFSYEFLDNFMKSVLIIDKAATANFGDAGAKWIGREVSMVALYGAIGNFTDEPSKLLSISEKLAQNFQLCNLLEYEECRNSVDLAKVNIGNINKKYIFKAFGELINNDFQHKINWEELFAGEKN